MSSSSETAARSRPPKPGEPLLIVHRAGNDLDALREALTMPAVDMIETDVHLYRGRLEIRHMKTIGPINILWDRNPWRIANPFAPRLLLEHVLEALGDRAEIMLDLKGRQRGLPAALADAVERVARDRPYTVCSRTWSYLNHFQERTHARVVYSAGSPRQLAAVMDRTSEVHGISIAHELLDRATVERLRERMPIVMAWTVNDPARAEELESWGVNGFITDTPDRLAGAIG
jgi:glycerophosphoryl diester phosphodiesterase